MWYPSKRLCKSVVLCTFHQGALLLLSGFFYSYLTFSGGDMCCINFCSSFVLDVCICVLLCANDHVGYTWRLSVCRVRMFSDSVSHPFPDILLRPNIRTITKTPWLTEMFNMVVHKLLQVRDTATLFCDQMLLQTRLQPSFRLLYALESFRTQPSLVIACSPI